MKFPFFNINVKMNTVIYFKIMTGGFNISSLIKTFFRFVIPSIMAMWVFSFYTMVDGYFIANYVGELEFSAVNIAMPFVNSLFALAIIFGVGTSTIVGILLGKNKNKEANEVFSSVLGILILFSIVLTISFKVFLPQIVEFLGATKHTEIFVKQYLSIILYFCIFFMVSYNLEVMVKIDGFPILATVGVIISGVTNILLDYLFVAIFHWGITGAAIATGIAQVLSCVVFLFHFIFGKSKLKIVKTKLKLNLLKQVIPIGLGDFLNEMSTSLIILLFNNFLPSTLGEKSLISYTVISYITLFILATMSGLTQGMQPLVSFYYGKKDKKSYRNILIFAITIAIILSLIAFAIVNIFTKDIVQIFLENSDFDILSITYSGIHKYSLSYLIVGLNLLIGGFFAAMGHAKPAIILSLSRGFVFIFLALQFVIRFFKAENIWFAATISEGLSLIVAIFFLYRIIKNSYALK